MASEPIVLYHSTLIMRGKISTDVCDAMVADYKNRSTLHKTTHSSRGYRYLSNEDMNIDVMSAYELSLEQLIMDYIHLFPHSQETITNWSLVNQYNIQHYAPGHHYSTWHCENNGQPHFKKRHLAFMTYLNDVEDGGGTEFLHQNTEFKAKKGVTLIWPAYFTHIHRGILSATQDKYVTTGWFEFVDNEKLQETLLDQSDEDFYSENSKLY